MNSGILTPTLMRWGGLVVIALAELTWLAIRVEVPSTGFLSVFKGFLRSSSIADRINFLVSG